MKGQLGMFDDAPVPAVAAKRPKAAASEAARILRAARAAGETAAAMAKLRALRHDPEFVARAKACILAALATGPRSSEDLVDACLAQEIKPPDDRAFGSVIAALARRGEILFVDFCLRRKGRGTAGGRVWRRGS